MVTASHIPADRNRHKFYSPRGELSKNDELGIAAALLEVGVPEGDAGKVVDAYPQAGDLYRQRYRRLLPTTALSGKVIGVFEHSSVARDILVSLLTRCGAEVVRLGREAGFVAVDTEAFSDPVFHQPRRRAHRGLRGQWRRAAGKRCLGRREVPQGAADA
jgi:phosphomannomutase